MPVNFNKVIRREVVDSDPICEKTSRKGKNIFNDLVNGSIALCAAIYRTKKAYRKMTHTELAEYKEYASRPFIKI